jgi:antitoxin VapB
MTLNVKNPETTRLIRELARATGESMTQALTTAVRERLNRVQSEAKADRVQAIVSELRARLPAGYLDRDLDALLYDEATGLPK